MQITKLQPLCLFYVSKVHFPLFWVKIQGGVRKNEKKMKNTKNANFELSNDTYRLKVNIIEFRLKTWVN